MKYLITGGSGYIGSRLTDLLIQHEDNEVVNLDIRAPAVPRSRTRFVHMDIRDRGIAALIAQERPDALVHLAFVLNPIRDEHTMYDIDVNGTANVLDAAAAAGVPHLLVASSTTAYGAWPDNPVPIPEEHPVRGLPAYEYARDKTEIDRLCQLWAAQHPDSTMTIVRPTIVFGPNVDNYIVRFWTNQPLHRAARRARRRLAVRARGGRRRRDLPAAGRAARRHLQPHRRRHDQALRGGQRSRA